jgi:hypothetical protein
MGRKQQGRSAAYGPLLAVYMSGVTVAAVAVRVARPRIAEPRAIDVVLLGTATFKLSRLVANDKVLEPVRDPFVEETSPGEGSELNCEPAGVGVRRALGELLTCPFCLSVWIGTALIFGFAVAPRAVRLVAAGLSAVAFADCGQYAYAGLRNRVQQSAP